MLCSARSPGHQARSQNARSSPEVSRRCRWRRRSFATWTPTAAAASAARRQASPSVCCVGVVLLGWHRCLLLRKKLMKIDGIRWNTINTLGLTFVGNMGRWTWFQQALWLQLMVAHVRTTTRTAWNNKKSTPIFWAGMGCNQPGAVWLGATWGCFQVGQPRKMLTWFMGAPFVTHVGKFRDHPTYVLLNHGSLNRKRRTASPWHRNGQQWWICRRKCCSNWRILPSFCIDPGARKVMLQPIGKW